MRVLVLVIMILTFLVGGGSSSLLKLNLDSRTENIDYKGLEEMEKKLNQLKKDGINLEEVNDPSIKSSLEALEKAPAKWRVNIAGILGIIVGFVALYMVIAAFRKKEIVKKASMGVVASSILLWLLVPSIKAGTYSGANPKNIALTALVFLLISAVCAFLSYNMHLKKSITA